MDASTLEVRMEPDGTAVIRPRGAVAAADAAALQRVLVRTLRRIRPTRLVLDLGAVSRLDPINAGSVCAACELGDDHQVAVFVDNPSSRIAGQLVAAGIPRQCLRQT